MKSKNSKLAERNPKFKQVGDGQVVYLYSFSSFYKSKPDVLVIYLNNTEPQNLQITRRVELLSKPDEEKMDH